MKEFHVEIGGKSRRLAFNTSDGLALKRRFNQPPAMLMFQRVMGLDPAKARPGFSQKPDLALVDPEVQIALLHAALLRGGATKATEEQVMAWLDAAMAEGRAMSDLVLPALQCAFYSGAVTGQQVDLEAVISAGASEAEPPAGKASASEEAT